MINSIKNKYAHLTKSSFSRAFTLVELVVVVVVIGIIGTIGVTGFTTVQKDVRDDARKSQATIIADTLEKYYDDNNEYPSVALVTSQSIATIQQKLKIKDTHVLKFPLASASATTSIVTSSPSSTRVVYSANTSDNTKNTQCQTDVNGYCDGFQLQYINESDGSVVIESSRHDTFTPASGTTTCASGETQTGSTCTKTYAATYQSGTYSCPSGGTLSGTTCTSTYTASYSSGGGYYTCPSGGTLSGSTCTTTSSYGASYASGGGYYYCPNTANHEVLSGTTCVGYQTYAAYQGTGCPSGYAGNPCSNSYFLANPGRCPAGATVVTSTGGNVCIVYTNSITTYSCVVGDSLSGTTCTHPTSYSAIYDTYPGYYYCPSGGSLSGSTCTTSSSYAATWTTSAGYYYCNSGDSLSGTTCTHSYTATQSGGYYYCSSGGTVSGSTCTYSYNLP